MSINIKNREAERLLAEIKAATGQGTSQIVRELLGREALRLRRARRVAARRRVVEALAKRYSARLPAPAAGTATAGAPDPGAAPSPAAAARPRG